MKSNLLLNIILASAVSVMSAPAWSYESKPAELAGTEKPAEFAGIGIDEKLGSHIDLNTPFVDETGKAVTLKDYYNGKNPVVISLVYFDCPGLCNLHLNGVVDALKKVDLTPGKNFEYLVISFDPKETKEDAIAKKASYMKEYGRPGTENGWHFLTGTQASISQVTSQVGFKYRWDDKSKQWAHASAAILTAPDGKVSRYLHGIMIEPDTFRLALIEAGEGKLGGFTDKLVWFCFKYDSSRSKYTLYAFRIVQIGALLAILLLAGLLIPAWLKAKKSA